MSTRAATAAVVLAACAAAAVAGAPEAVSSSEPLSPEAERAALEVPAGFVIQLVAAEPAIGKPISLAFDASGRLWVAETRTYPIEPLPDKTPRDAIRILSDFGPDGLARRNDVFADGLVMPDAVVPHATGAWIFAVPNILNLVDDNGDGRADRRDVVLGPFDTRDMHNLPNSFRRGFDGWIYGGHGILNASTVKGRDGHEARLQGASFRFRPDGSRIELFGHGQANPFGFCFDRQGNFYSSDCHSLPIYELVRGGFYPSFGRPHDGLGFAPPMMQHAHGSTGLAGLCVCDDDSWPDEYRGNMLLGNVVTNRVNRDRITTAGTTKTAHEMPDLVISRDPWFRPVDVQFGPDGAIYVADFYNRIICHVEVPLDHPGRDRDRGRIWRIVPVDAAGTPLLRPVPDLAREPLPAVVAALSHPNITVRLAALNRLADIGGADVIAAATAELAREGGDARGRAAALWILERLAAVEPSLLGLALRDADPLVRVHAMRVLCERPTLAAGERAAAIAALRDADPLVRRTAADALGRHPGTDTIRPLLDLRHATPADDASLVYMARKSLRDQLLAADAFAAVAAMPLSPQDRRSLADVCLAIPSPAAAAFLATSLADGVITDAEPPGVIEHAIRHLAPADVAGFSSGMRKLHPADLDARVRLLQQVCQGLERRGIQPADGVGEWAAVVVADLLASSGDARSRAPRQTAAADIAGKCRVTGAATALAAVAGDAGADVGARLAAFRAAASLDPAAATATGRRLLDDSSLSADQRGDVGVVLAAVDLPEARGGAADVIRTAAAAVRGRVAAALAGTAAGADTLLETVAAGKAPAELLVDPALRQKLAVVRPGDPRIAALAAGVKPADARLQRVVDDRVRAYHAGPRDAARGEAVFTAKCGACHAVDGQGDKLAPGLGGVGLRGVERLCEDIAAPNRNVDPTFRMSVIALDDGRVLSGLFRREEGTQLVFADQAGREFSIAADAIESRTDSAVSLMPEGFGESLAPQEFTDLLEFLIARPRKG